MKDSTKDGKTRDHGICSAYKLYLTAKKEGLLKSDFSQIIMLACRMILFHTCFIELNWDEKFFLAKEMPLDFFLCLIDNCQECGRKIKDKNEKQNVILVDILEFQELKYDEKSMEHIFKYENTENLRCAGFINEIHKESKRNSLRSPKFLKMFDRTEFIFPELNFTYYYWNLATGEPLQPFTCTF